MASWLERLAGVPGSIPPGYPRRPGMPAFTPGPMPVPQPAPGLGRLAAIGDQPAYVQIPGIPRPVAGPVPTQDTYKVIQIPTGKRGTDATLKAMGELAIEASRDPYFVNYWRGVVRDCGPRDHRCIVDTIFNHVKDNTTYFWDPRYCEFVMSPGFAFFVSGQLDCDDMATLLSAAFTSVGFATRLVAVGTESTDEYSHVYCEVEIPGAGWVAADPVIPNSAMGTAVPTSAYKMPPNILYVAPH